MPEIRLMLILNSSRNGLQNNCNSFIWSCNYCKCHVQVFEPSIDQTINKMGLSYNDKYVFLLIRIENLCNARESI